MLGVGGVGRRFEEINHTYELKCRECGQWFEKDDYGIFPSCPHGRITPYEDQYGKNRIDYSSQMSCPWEWRFGGNNLVIAFDCYDNDHSKENESERYFYNNAVKIIDRDDIYAEPFRVVFHNGNDKKYIPDFYIEPQRLIVEVRGHSTTEKILKSNREKISYMVSYPTILNDPYLTSVNYLFISELGYKDYEEYGISFIKFGDQDIEPAFLSIQEASIIFGTYNMLKDQEPFLILGFKDYKIHLISFKDISDEFAADGKLLFEVDYIYENYTTITLCELLSTYEKE